MGEAAMLNNSLVSFFHRKVKGIPIFKELCADSLEVETQNYLSDLEATEASPRSMPSYNIPGYESLDEEDKEEEMEHPGDIQRV